MNCGGRHLNDVPVAWDSDRVDRAREGQVEDAYFDEPLSAWVFSRYSDVEAAFRSSALVPVGPRSKTLPDTENEDLAQEMRAEVRRVLSTPVLAGWQSNFENTARTLLETLNAPGPVDLVGQYAAQLCDHVAVTVTRIASPQASNLTELAEQISEAAAEPLDSRLAQRAKENSAELQQYFTTGPTALRDSGFVALFFTLRRMLSNAWLALIQEPNQWGRLHDDPSLVPQAIEELMRFAGLPRMLFRMATQDVVLNGTQVGKGQRIILRLIAANRDPAQFNEPNDLHLSRHPARHLCLGTGTHACAGAPLLRMVMAVATRRLVQRYWRLELCQPVKWEGGSGFLFPSALHVMVKDNSRS